MTLESWLAYATLMFVVCITPRPAVARPVGDRSVNLTIEKIGAETAFR